MAATEVAGAEPNAETLAELLAVRGTPGATG